MSGYTVKVHAQLPGLITSTGWICGACILWMPLIGNEIMAQLTQEENDIKAALDAEYATFAAQAIPEFITGERDIRSDADWEAFCNDVNAFRPEEFTNALNRILQGK